MKKTMTYVLAAAAVVVGLVSCSKAKLPEAEQKKEQEKPQQGLRTLTVSFAAGTKTTPTPGTDGETQPVWAAGDKISLDGVVYEVPPEAVGKATCTITTDIQGSIKAVYPADAYVSESPYYKVADSQDGSFGSANICYAQVGPEETTIRFNNVTAVFEVNVPAHTTELVVTSLGEIDSTTGKRETTVRPINSTGSDVNAKQKITVTVTDSDNPTTCYVSVLVDGTNPVLLTNLNFDAVTGNNTGAQGGVSPSYIKSKGKDPLAYKVEVNTIYTPVLHEYVKLNDIKWATMNVGATSVIDFGYYFAWGGTEGYKHVDSKWVRASDNEELSGGFSLNNAPYYDSSKYTKYSTEEGGKTVLELADDAAYFNWGGAWRMPSAEEFDALDKLPTGILKRHFQVDNVQILQYYKDSDIVSLPAAGFVHQEVLDSGKTKGCYWFRNLSDDSTMAKCLEFSEDNEKVSYTQSRYYGQSVRAVSN